MADLRQRLAQRIATMNEGQLGLVSVIVDTFSQEIRIERNPASDVADTRFVDAFGDFLKLHHSLSAAYLDKTRFEVALERILRALGRAVVRPASRTHRGHDLSVDGQRWSLKTHGDASIKLDSLFISKFMELGGGNWGDTDLADVEGLRNQFLRHLAGYDRVFQLRYFHNDGPPEKHRYELIEIPKSLLLESGDGTLTWADRSRSNPRCAYCTIKDKDGRIKFRLYFDGGGERKLQIKGLPTSLCVVHATWEFAVPSPTTLDAS